MLFRNFVLFSKAYIIFNGDDLEDTKSPRRAAPLKIKNFKTIVNGKEVKSNVELLSKLLSRGILDNKIIKEYSAEEKERNFYNYVYYFSADFKKGINVLEHSYFIRVLMELMKENLAML